MIAKFNFGSLDQKTLYYKINSCINLDIETDTRRSGVYAIFKDDICLYVGQSKNLASRSASHILGKYKNCDYIKLIDITHVGFGNFWDRSESSRTAILNNVEIALMQILKPIENIITDYTKIIPENQIPSFEEWASFTIDCRETFDDYLTIASETDHIIVGAHFHYRAAKGEDINSIVCSYQIDDIVIKDVK
jgi:hypothetical protein